MRNIRWTRSGSLPILTIMASALIAPVSESASPDTSEWKCQLCPFENGYHADIAAGVSYVSEDTATFGNATGYDQKGGYANVDGSGRYAADAYRLSWQAQDLGLDSRVVEIDGARSFRLQPGVEETVGVIQGSALEEVELHMILENSACNHIAFANPHSGIPFPIFADF